MSRCPQYWRAAKDQHKSGKSCFELAALLIGLWNLPNLANGQDKRKQDV
jgi:hypothetical protein